MFHDLWHGVMEAAYTGPERIQVWGVCSTVQLLKERKNICTNLL